MVRAGLLRIPAYLGDGGGLNFNFDVTGGGWGGGTGGPAGPTPGQWLLNNINWLAPLVAAALVVGLALLTLLIWLQSRGKFLFIAALANNRAAVVEPWKHYRALGNSLFRFRLLVLLVTAGLTVLAVGLAGLIAWSDLMAGVLTAQGIGAIVLTAVTLPALMLVYLLIGVVTEDFLAPAMYARQAPVRQAWTLLRREVFAGNIAMILLFYLMRILIGIVVAMLAFVGTCLTCCLAAIPYLGTVILLPLFVFQRCYSLYFIQQFGGPWRIFAAPGDQPPACPACGYDLRGNPTATHCPECGCQLPAAPLPASSTPACPSEAPS